MVSCGDSNHSIEIEEYDNELAEYDANNSDDKGKPPKKPTQHTIAFKMASTKWSDVKTKDEVNVYIDNIISKLKDSEDFKQKVKSQNLKEKDIHSLAVEEVAEIWKLIMSDDDKQKYQDRADELNAEE